MTLDYYWNKYFPLTTTTTNQLSPPPTRTNTHCHQHKPTFTGTKTDCHQHKLAPTQTTLTGTNTNQHPLVTATYTNQHLLRSTDGFHQSLCGWSQRKRVWAITRWVAVAGEMPLSRRFDRVSAGQHCRCQVGRQGAVLATASGPLSSHGLFDRIAAAQFARWGKGWKA